MSPPVALADDFAAQTETDAVSSEEQHRTVRVVRGAQRKSAMTDMGGTSAVVAALGDAVSTQDDPPVLPERATIRVPDAPPRTGNTILLQQWQGTVVEILTDEFVAITRDVKPGFPEEQVTLLLEDVPLADRALVEPGAVFYWTISYEEDEYGTRTRSSRLRFRRLPAWSRRDLERVKREAAELSEFFAAE